MRKLTALAAVAAILAAGGTAAAKEKGSETAGTVKEKKICKHEADSDTSTRIARRKVCKTKAQWSRMSNPGSADDSGRKVRETSGD